MSVEQQPQPERPRRARAVRGVLAASLCLLLALGALVVYRAGHAPPPAPTCTVRCPILLYGSGGLQPPASQITAIRQSDGATLWNTSLTKLGNPYHAALASGVAYVALTNCAVRPCTDWIAALRLSDGTLLWHVQVTGLITHMTAGSAGVYAESYDDVRSTPTFYALRARDGSSLWHAPAGMLGFTPLAVSDGMLYLSETDMTYHRSVLAVHDDTGIPVFHVALPGLFAVTTSSTGVLYASINQSPGSALIYAISTRDGSILWTQTLPPSQVHGGWENLSLTASTLVVVEPYNVYGLDLTSGATRWRYHVPATFALGTADSARVYLLLTTYPSNPAGTGFTTTTLRALDPHTGASLWSQSTGLYNQDFVVTGGSLFVSQTPAPVGPCTSGCVAMVGPTRVCALTSATGAIKWCARQPSAGQILAGQ